MRKSIWLIFFFTLLFSCDTSSYNSAYKDYYANQQKYIESLVDGDKQKEINALKELVKCGKFLNFNVTEYEKKLNYLTSNTTNTHKTATIKKTSKPLLKPAAKSKLPVYINHTESKYVKIQSLNPVIISIPNEKLKTFRLYKKNKYFKQVIDVKNARFKKGFFKKELNGVTLKIAQHDKNTVRIVFAAKKPFYFKYKVKNKLLYAFLNKKSYSKPIIPRFTSAPKKPTQKDIIQKVLANLRKKIIIIDPGHGGKDPGGIGIGRAYEKRAVLQIAKYIKYYLNKYGLYRVYLTRSKDVFLTLKQRTRYAINKKANLFVSIHCNIAPKHLTSPHGIETYYLSPTRDKKALRVANLENKSFKQIKNSELQSIVFNMHKKDSAFFGKEVQYNLIKTLKKRYSYIKDGGVRPAPFWVLVGTQVPAILIETGYLTNPREVKRLFSPTYQRYLAKGIANGIYNYLLQKELLKGGITNPSIKNKLIRN